MLSYTPSLLQSYKSDLDDEIDKRFWLRYATDRGCITLRLWHMVWCNGLWYLIAREIFDGYIGICTWYMVEVHVGYMVETSSWWVGT